MARSRFDAFISHAGKDAAQAETIEAALGTKRVWLDRSEIRLGALLGRELLSNLRASRALVLVWSKRAARSPWVQSEWIAAANLAKPIVPIRLDKTALPQALSNALWGAGGKSFKETAAQLARTIRGGLARGPSISPSMRLPNPKLEQEVARLALAQSAMLDAFDGGSPAKARRLQRLLETQTTALIRKHPRDPRAATLWAYNEKNSVVLEHDADIMAGIKVDDGRLEEARWRFLHGLWLDPLDPEALNGLGTIAWFGHDLDTAEFFVRAALRRLPDYENAKHDLALILDLKRLSRRPSKRRA
ncbi:MAG TPA: TIR domain-containing protein [Vicinamibacterales bacterium]|nr:TIR domain-containing protein [Vicinamibacterales bacterium]